MPCFPVEIFFGTSVAVDSSLLAMLSHMFRKLLTFAVAVAAGPLHTSWADEEDEEDEEEERASLCMLLRRWFPVGREGARVTLPPPPVLRRFSTAFSVFSQSASVISWTSITVITVGAAADTEVLLVPMSMLASADTEVLLVPRSMLACLPDTEWRFTNCLICSIWRSNSSANLSVMVVFRKLSSLSSSLCSAVRLSVRTATPSLLTPLS
mmetsp:Transcript_37746/g.74246  ORF Transcript_37746/g.74246 Transcript_37746/m.74246 type:complete len:210 (-) Transcript_37746:399-1028(-)